jgi:phosphatidylglycerol:prolipoprotein diacylglycerol transferase
MAVGRIGCFLNGCCFGGACQLPWAMTFPFGSPPHIQQVERGKLTLHGLRFEGEPDDPPVIASVEEGSAADRAGLKPGQRVERIVAKAKNDDRLREWKVDTIAEVQSTLLQISEEGTEVRLRVSSPDQASKETLAWTLPAALPRSTPIHPTQLYSAIDAFLLLFVLLAYEPFQRRDGAQLALLLTLHPISRFLLEVVRIDEASMFGTGLSISQLISIAALAGAAILWYFVLRQPRRQSQGAPA